MSPRDDIESNGPTLEEVDAVLRQDFVAFTAKVFATLNPGYEFKPNWHHRVIAHQLMEVMEGRRRYLIINIPPRHLKSIRCPWPSLPISLDITRRDGSSAPPTRRI